MQLDLSQQVEAAEATAPVEVPSVVKPKAKRKPAAKKLSSVPWPKYKADPRISISRLKSAAKSALQYKYDLEHEREDTDALIMGRAVHCAVFEPDKFLSHYVAWRNGRRAGGEWDRFKAANEAGEILTADDYDRCLEIRKTVRNDKRVIPYLKAGVAEACLYWTDAVTGMGCKGRADFVSDSQPAILDLKTTRDISKFMADAYRMQYHLQAAFYRDATKAMLDADLPFVVISVENQPPYDLGVFPVPPETIDAGRREYRRLLDLVQHCEKTGVWPGAYDMPQDLILPAWATKEEDDEIELDINGETVTV
jgi:hypothetical protein